MSGTEYSRSKQLRMTGPEAQTLAVALMQLIEALSAAPPSDERTGDLARARSLLERVHDA